MWLAYVVCVGLCSAVISAQYNVPQCPGSPHCLTTHCPPHVCPSTCAYGTTIKADQNGCSTCSCARRCPRRPTCARTTQCSHGILQVNGCTSPTCECNVATCPPISCTAPECPKGFAKDTSGYGCPTCQCRGRRSSVACKPHKCLETHSCPIGLSREKRRGCPVCLCTQPPTCPTLNCVGMYCQFGPVYVDGCPTCDCRPPPVVCPQLSCMRTNCRRGFANDTSGCPTCTCYGSKTPPASQGQWNNPQAAAAVMDPAALSRGSTASGPAIPHQPMGSGYNQLAYPSAGAAARAMSGQGYNQGHSQGHNQGYNQGSPAYSSSPNPPHVSAGILATLMDLDLPEMP